MKLTTTIPLILTIFISIVLLSGCGKSAEEKILGVYAHEESGSRLHLQEKGTAKLYFDKKDLDSLWKLVDGEIILTPVKVLYKDVKNLVFVVNDDGSLNMITMTLTNGKRLPAGNGRGMPFSKIN